MHLGSNLEWAARSCNKSILVASRIFKTPRKVLLAFDGGASVLKAVEFFTSQSCFNTLSCHLLSVGRDSTADRRQLEGAVASLRSGGYTVTSENLTGTPEAVIAEQVETQGFDLVIMGAYGHSRIRSLIFGSTTTGMIRSCKVPVLLFR